MSVLIKGMNMPKNCGSCPFMREALWRGKVYPYVCSVKALVIKPSEIIFRDGLCPLVDVPTPHGRLIDADAVMNEVFAHSYPLSNWCNTNDEGMFVIGIQQVVDESPTIIEAEEE